LSQAAFARCTGEGTERAPVSSARLGLYASRRRQIDQRRRAPGADYALIIANVVAVALETIPSICARWHVFFGDFEKFSVGGYTVEYIIRMWSSVEDSRIDGEDANSDLQPVRLVNVECMTLTLFFFCIRLSRFIHRLTVPTIRRRP